MINVVNKTVKDGINLYFVKDDKFKTAALTLSFVRPLKKDEVTKNSLIPAIIRRGCEKYPDTRKLNLYLDSLYGAEFTSGVRKKGEVQMITFKFKTVADIYAGDVLPFDKLISLMKEAIFNPLTENGGFKDDFVEREKENLKQMIESIVNDKKEYAKKRLIEEMYKDSPYGIFEYGYTEDLNAITSKNLFEHYENVLKTSRINIFVTGAFDEKCVTDRISEIFEGISVNPVKINDIEKDIINNEITTIEEEAPVTQGKLSMGFKTNITSDSPLYIPMLLANNLYGGSVHSKLFLNVREKMSLAYYAGSSYSSFKGLVNVNCGIEFDKYEVTVKEVLNQLEEMKKGNFTEEELNFSKLAICSTYNSLADSMAATEDFFNSQTIMNTKYTIEEYIEKVKATTKEQVIEAAKKIIPDTVFFLKGSAKNWNTKS